MARLAATRQGDPSGAIHRDEAVAARRADPYGPEVLARLEEVERRIEVFERHVSDCADEKRALHGKVDQLVDVVGGLRLTVFAFLAGQIILVGAVLAALWGRLPPP